MLKTEADFRLYFNSLPVITDTYKLNNKNLDEW